MEVLVRTNNISNEAEAFVFDKKEEYLKELWQQYAKLRANFLKNNDWVLIKDKTFINYTAMEAKIYAVNIETGEVEKHFWSPAKINDMRK